MNMQATEFTGPKRGGIAPQTGDKRPRGNNPDVNSDVGPAKRAREG